MGRPRNTERNKELVKKREQGWTFERLGRFFNVKKPRAWEIYYQEVGKGNLQKVSKAS